jgi:hypothetical protein
MPQNCRSVAGASSTYFDNNKPEAQIKINKDEKFSHNNVTRDVPTVERLLVDTLTDLESFIDHYVNSSINRSQNLHSPS